MMRSLHILGFLLLAVPLTGCAADALDGVQTRPDETDGPGPTDGGTFPDTGTPTNPSGEPYPNLYTDGDAERCLLLFGGTDRVKSDDVGMPLGNAPRTLQAWVRTNWDGEQVALSYGRGSIGQGLTIGVVDGVGFVDANGTTRILGDTRIDDDEWHHLAGVWDGNNAIVVVDGQTDAFGLLEADTQSGGTAVGNRPEASPERHPWVGWIDDVRIFDIARSPDTFVDDLDGVAYDGNLELWYDFEVEGDVMGANVLIEDLSGNGHEGETAGSKDRPQFPFCR